MLRRHAILGRLVVWTIVVLTLILLVRHEQGIAGDSRVLALNACGADMINPSVSTSNPSLAEFTLGPEVTGITSLLDSTLAVGGKTRPLFAQESAWFNGAAAPTAVKQHASEVRYDFTNATGALRSATYAMTVRPAQRTVTLSLVTKPAPGMHLSDIGFPVTLVGFDVQPPGGTVRRSGTISVKTTHPWVVLKNNRCTLLAWGTGLRAVHATSRPGRVSIIDVLLHERADVDASGSVNLTYLYGDAFRSDSPSAVETLLRHLEGALP